MRSLKLFSCYFLPYRLAPSGGFAVRDCEIIRRANASYQARVERKRDFNVNFGINLSCGWLLDVASVLRVSTAAALLLSSGCVRGPFKSILFSLFHQRSRSKRIWLNSYDVGEGSDSKDRLNCGGDITCDEMCIRRGDKRKLVEWEGFVLSSTQAWWGFLLGLCFWIERWQTWFDFFGMAWELVWLEFVGFRQRVSKN